MWIRCLAHVVNLSCQFFLKCIAFIGLKKSSSSNFFHSISWRPFGSGGFLLEEMMKVLKETQIWIQLLRLSEFILLLRNHCLVQSKEKNFLFRAICLAILSNCPFSMFLMEFDLMFFRSFKLKITYSCWIRSEPKQANGFQLWFQNWARYQNLSENAKSHALPDKAKEFELLVSKH